MATPAPIPLSSIDHPPPYIEAAAADLHAKEPSIIEALPAYAATPPVVTSVSNTRAPFLKRYRCWLLLTSVLLVIFIVVGTVLGVILHRKAIKGEGPADPIDPAIRALTAAECEGGSFVLYQDQNAFSVWLEGTLGNGTNGTAISPFVVFRNTAVEGTSLSAVCFVNGTTLELHIFYVSKGIFTPPYIVNEAIMSFEDYTTTKLDPDYGLIPKPQLTATSPLVEFLSNSSSLASTYLPSTQTIYLFYLRGDARLMLLSNDGGSGWSNAEDLSIFAKGSTAPLAVTIKDGTGRSQQISVALIGGDGKLNTLFWNPVDSWSNAQSWTSTLGSTNYPGADIESISHITMTPALPTLSGIGAMVYYIASDHRPYSWTLRYGTSAGTQDSAVWPDAMKSPGLITTMINAQGQTVLYYVLREASSTGNRGYDIVKLRSTLVIEGSVTGWVDDGLVANGNPFGTL
ncbi:uncharacterized protein PAC_00038 [Phialocephala subalpina]|uniref:Fucose-specific lectin n=1 Tax=Phialocephala subalpina TaxID=576137 RepID=A0A1L7WBK7_9HELO|nr:uncharacterized protein PAC_00038 [Phialocephala subalpina]